MGFIKKMVKIKFVDLDIQPDRQRHSQKPFFRIQWVSKRGDLTKTAEGCQILHRSNTFSAENIKI